MTADHGPGPLPACRGLPLTVGNGNSEAGRWHIPTQEGSWFRLQLPQGTADVPKSAVKFSDNSQNKVNLNTFHLGIISARQSCVRKHCLQKEVRNCIPKAWERGWVSRSPDPAAGAANRSALGMWAPGPLGPKLLEGSACTLSLLRSTDYRQAVPGTLAAGPQAPSLPAGLLPCSPCSRFAGGHPLSSCPWASPQGSDLCCFLHFSAFFLPPPLPSSITLTLCLLSRPFKSE